MASLSRKPRVGPVGIFVLLLGLPLFGCEAAGENASNPSIDRARLELVPCRIEDIGDARCGTFEVFENRRSRQGRKIPLRVVMIGEPDSEEPVVYVAGGPGASVVDQAPRLVRWLREPLANRPLLLVDARGTGGSNPLFCPYQLRQEGLKSALESFIPAARLPDCRRALEQRADLAQYSTAHLVDDLDQVRAALGYEKIHLVGGSYGTRVAQVYLRRRPQALHTVTMLGVSPMDAFLPSDFARDAQDALDALFRECHEDEACARAFPDPAADLKTVQARLRQAPVELQGPDGGSLSFGENAFKQTLRYMLYFADSALRVPAYLRAAAEGDFEPFAHQAWVRAGGLMQSLSDGLYLSITCSEDVAHIDMPAARASVVGTFLGEFRLQSQVDACAQWPTFELPARFHRPVRARIPTLLVSGERDPVTPVAGAERVAAHLENSRHLIIPDGAHGSFTLPGIDCVGGLIAELMARRSVDGLDLDGCRQSISRPPFPLAP